MCAHISDKLWELFDREPKLVRLSDSELLERPDVVYVEETNTLTTVPVDEPDPDDDEPDEGDPDEEVELRWEIPDLEPLTASAA
jgi:hypothetical protein